MREEQRARKTGSSVPVIHEVTFELSILSLPETASIF